MNSRQTLTEYIQPSQKRKTVLWVLGIAALALSAAGACIYFLSSLSAVGGITMLIGIFTAATWACLLPAYSSGAKNLKYSLRRLEELGLLDNAAAELTGEDKLVVAGDRSRLTPGFAFRRHAGIAVAFEDIIWLRIYPGRSQDIEISTSIRTGRTFAPVSLLNRNSNYEEINRAYAYIAGRCPTALNGFSTENAKAFREAVKQYNSAGK